MNERRTSIFPVAASAVLIFALGGCGSDTESEDPAASERKRYPHRKEMEVGEDDLVRVRGETEPYSGVVIHGDGVREISYFASYENGEPHGPEIHYHENGRIRKILDFHHGEKVHHREWFENGVQKVDALMKDGIAYGRHRMWFEDGSLRFSARLQENLRWDGPVRDVGADGKLMWDAIFKDGKYLSGHYPEEAQADLIERRLLKPEDAIYPLRGSEEAASSGAREKEK